MKKIFLSLALIATLFTSCDMDEFPPGALRDENAIQTKLDAYKFRNGFYFSLRSMTNGGWLTVPDIQADMFIGTYSNGNRNGPISLATFNASSNDIAGFWSSPYSVIKNCNYFFEKMEELSENGTFSEADMPEINHYISEAYFTRAYCYYQLADKYCNSYNRIDPTSAASGVPLVTKYDPTNDYSKYPGRNTLTETFELIESDLQKAFDGLTAYEKDASADFKKLNLAPNAPYLSSYAIAALQARIALLKGENSLAIEKANYVINSGIYSLTSMDDYVNMWTGDVGSELIFVPYGDKNQSGNVASPGAAFINADGDNADYLPTSDCLAMYDQMDDVRFDAFFEARNLKIDGSIIKAPCFVKFPGNRALDLTATNSLKNNSKPFRLTEMYLIIAEASAETNPTLANQMLNAVRKARIYEYKDEIYAGSELVDEIREERAKEFIGEGFRISDLRRWGLPFARSAEYPTKYANVVSILREDGIAVSYPVGYYKYVLPIPVDELDANPQIANQQNPGY